MTQGCAVGLVLPAAAGFSGRLEAAAAPPALNPARYIAVIRVPSPRLYQYPSYQPSGRPMANIAAGTRSTQPTMRAIVPQPDLNATANCGKATAVITAA